MKKILVVMFLAVKPAVAELVTIIVSPTGVVRVAQSGEDVPDVSTLVLNEAYEKVIPDKDTQEVQRPEEAYWPSVDEDKAFAYRGE